MVIEKGRRLKIGWRCLPTVVLQKQSPEVLPPPGHQFPISPSVGTEQPSEQIAERGDHKTVLRSSDKVTF